MSHTSIAQTIPAEVLEIILKDAVQSAIPDERLLTALGLSLICKSFRDAALHCPDLWTCLSRRLGRPGLALIKASIERSKERPLDVIFNFYPCPAARGGGTTMVVDNIVLVILDTSSRWRSCSIHLTGDDPCDVYSSPPIDVFAFSTCVKIVGPILENLSIIEHGSLRERFAMDPSGRTYEQLERNFRPGAHWLLPNLRSFTLHNTRANMITWKFIPQIEFLKVGLSGITTGFMGHMAALQVLVAAKSLITLHLSVIDCLIKAFADTQVVEYPSVQTLRIEIIGCTRPDTNEHVLWTTFRKLYFPNVSELSLVVDFGGDDDPHSLTLWNGYNISLHSFLTTNLVHESRYPSLETLNVSFLSNGGPGSQRGEASPILFPHHCIPSLKHLRICAPWAITMSSSIDDSIGDLPEHFTIKHTGDPLSFRTVTLELLCARGVTPWIRQLASMMLDWQCWHAFSELRIVREGVTEVIPRDNVLPWCDANQEPQISQ